MQLRRFTRLTYRSSSFNVIYFDDSSIVGEHFLHHEFKPSRSVSTDRTDIDYRRGDYFGDAEERQRRKN